VIGTMSKILVFAAVLEVVTGLALLIAPSSASQLLLGAELAGVAIALGRVAGIALIGLGLSSWPGPAILGMLVYGVGVMLYLAYLGSAGEFVGRLLWPAVALHAVLSILLAWTWLKR
jgi:hypothetical protein